MLAFVFDSAPDGCLGGVSGASWFGWGGGGVDEGAEAGDGVGAVLFLCAEPVCLDDDDAFVGGAFASEADEAFAYVGIE